MDAAGDLKGFSGVGEIEGEATVGIFSMSSKGTASSVVLRT